MKKEVLKYLKKNNLMKAASICIWKNAVGVLTKFQLIY